MEKYTKWADKTTGIVPFLPPPTRRGMVLTCLRVLWTPIALARMLLFAASFGCLAATTLICYLIPLAFLSRPLQCLFELVLVRLMLFSLGFVWLSFANVDERMIAQETSSSPLVANAGHVIVSNHCSYVDLLLYSYLCSPLFAFPPNTAGESAAGCAYYRLVPALLHVIFAKGKLTPAQAVPTLEEVTNYASRCGAPVVVFPEATTTNGAGVLEWSPGLFEPLARIHPPPTIHLMAIRYGQVSSTYTCNNPFYHLLMLMWRTWNTVEVYFLEPGSVPPVDARFEKRARRLITESLLNSKLLTLSAQGKWDLLEYWRIHK
eukprot:gnl/Spiro4/17949_TR9569_c0_g1_i1.p1 gnl/Spiro4/17949_TR9569_c0_g1~~gnl/Spiro4/17949_TR9569_c0_g1_i1.p1  ORF type:complete len:337 (+),score=49.28 gnl/Spiro4/17949_TR9569_c0_g1_i1:57-1013(+)